VRTGLVYAHHRAGKGRKAVHDALNCSSGGLSGGEGRVCVYQGAFHQGDGVERGQESHHDVAVAGGSTAPDRRVYVATGTCVSGDNNYKRMM